MSEENKEVISADDKDYSKTGDNLKTNENGHVDVSDEKDEGQVFSKEEAITDSNVLNGHSINQTADEAKSINETDSDQNKREESSSDLNTKETNNGERENNTKESSELKTEGLTENIQETDNNTDKSDNNENSVEEPTDESVPRGVGEQSTEKSSIKADDETRLNGNENKETEGVESNGKSGDNIPDSNTSRESPSSETKAEQSESNKPDVPNDLLNETTLSHKSERGDEESATNVDIPSSGIESASIERYGDTIDSKGETQEPGSPPNNEIDSENKIKEQTNECDVDDVQKDAKDNKQETLVVTNKDISNQENPSIETNKTSSPRDGSLNEVEETKSNGESNDVSGKVEDGETVKATAEANEGVSSKEETESQNNTEKNNLKEQHANVEGESKAENQVNAINETSIKGENSETTVEKQEDSNTKTNGDVCDNQNNRESDEKISDNKTANESPDNSESNSKEKEDQDNIDQTLTKVVISDDGIPQVTLTSVPDRPPSSAAGSVGDRNESMKTETDDTMEGENTGDVGENNKVLESDSKALDDEKSDVHGEEKSEESKNETAEKTNVDTVETGAKVSSEEAEVDDKTKDEIKDDASLHGVDASRGETDKSKSVIDESPSQAEVVSKSDEPSNDTINSDSPADTEKTKESDQMQEVQEKDISKDETAKPGDESEKIPDNKQEPEKTAKSPEPVVHEPSPLEQLLEKNVEIQEKVDALDELEFRLTVLLTSMKNVTSHYSEVLKLQSLKDFTMSLGKFRGDFDSINIAFKRWGEICSNINNHFKDLRHETDNIRSTLYRKFQQEDLSTWIDISPEKEHEKELLEEQIHAAERLTMSKVADAKHAVATANTGVAEAHQTVAEMEKQAAEAEALATRAAAQAEAALVAVEEARIAAEERRKAEEIARQRAEERARIKKAEEEKKKAEEEMKIYQEAAKKGTNVEDERKKFLEEKAKREAERKNPKNWPRFYYNAKSVDFNPGVGCIIRAIDGSMRKPDVSCVVVDQSNGLLQLSESEEIVSNIVCVKQTDEERKFSFDEPISVALPVTLSRVPTGKEMVVKQLMPNGKWKDLPSADVQFDDYKEIKFYEGRSQRFGTYVVTLRPRKDQLQTTKRGSKMACSFDSRVSITSKPGSFKAATSFTLEVNPVDVNTIQDLRTNHPKECEDLITSSPFVTLNMMSLMKPEKPLTLTMPLPQTQVRQKRPATGVTRETKTPDVRPATARVSSVKEEEPTEEIHFLHRDNKTGWTVNRKINLVQPKNKDIVTFEITTPFHTMLLLRTKLGKRDLALEKMATLLEQTLNERSVKIILRQRHDDVSDVKVACVASGKTESTLKYLEENGYTEGPNPSPDLVLKEGQKLYMKFRGNIECTSKDPLLSFIFNSNIRAVRDFRVDEKESFAQKGLQCYRGFVQIFTKALVPKPVLDGANKSAQPEMVEAEVMLTELLIELPKPESMPPKPLASAPMFLKEGPLTNGVLRMLAGQLGKEWKDLAGQLNLKPMRIQAILRQHLNRDTPETRYDMLVAWAKRVPRAVDKVQILCAALTACGRLDLADEVKQRGQQFKQQRFMNARVSHLKQAFVKVAKATEMYNKWKSFAQHLGVTDEELTEVESKGGSGQEKCYTSLEKWQDKNGDAATITTLAKHLKDFNQEKLSRDVESIIAG